MGNETDDTCTDTGDSRVLRRIQVVYCGACGMPPEYCPYGPDYESHCDPWLQQHHPALRRQLLAAAREPTTTADGKQTDEDRPVKPDQPWTTEERLTAFYQKYVPEKIDAIPGLLTKYEGKEDKLFQALIQKYGPEPMDPYFSDESDDEDVDGVAATAAPASGVKTTSKRRGASAKTTGGPFTGTVLVQKQAQRKKRFLTVVEGLEPALAANNHTYKLKDATKAFSKRFAGSSSVNKNGNIIVQGDHTLELAELLVDKFEVPEECVYVDMGLGAVPLRG